MILERRLSREHDRRPSGDGSRLHLEEVKLRKKSTEIPAIKTVAVKYVSYSYYCNIASVHYILYFGLYSTTESSSTTKDYDSSTLPLLRRMRVKSSDDKSNKTVRRLILHIKKCAHTHARTHAHTYTYTHTHTHTHACYRHCMVLIRSCNHIICAPII